jgi:hypothetical protein
MLRLLLGENSFSDFFFPTLTLERLRGFDLERIL